MTALRWVSLRPNIAGMLVAILVTLALFGQKLETMFFPVLKDVTVMNVRIVEGVALWEVSFCKSRPLPIDNFGYIYNRGLVGFSIPIVVERAIQNAPGNLPTGCYFIPYMAKLPTDNKPGDTIESVVWYRSFHPFWMIPQSFGVVTLPAAAKSG